MGSKKLFTTKDTKDTKTGTTLKVPDWYSVSRDLT